MKQYTSREEREHIEAQFDDYIHKVIKNCVCNAVKKVERQEEKQRGIPFDDLSEEYIIGIMPDKYAKEVYEESGIVVEADLKIRVYDDESRRILERMTEREALVLVLREVYEYKYEKIAEILKITPERARIIKSNGVKKARGRGDGRGK